MFKSLSLRAAGIANTSRARVVLAACALAAMTSPVLAEDPPTYILDIGVDPTDVITGLQGVLVPFLVAAITIGFAFYAVKLGVRWIKGMARG